MNDDYEKMVECLHMYCTYLCHDIWKINGEGYFYIKNELGLDGKIPYASGAPQYFKDQIRITPNAAIRIFLFKARNPSFDDYITAWNSNLEGWR